MVCCANTFLQAVIELRDIVCLFLSEEESQESGNSQDESESSPTKKSPSKSFGEPSPTKTPAKPSFPESNNKDKVTYGDPPPNYVIMT